MSFNSKRQKVAAYLLIISGLSLPLFFKPGSYRYPASGMPQYPVIELVLILTGTGVLWLLCIACVKWWRGGKEIRWKSLDITTKAVARSGLIVWPAWLIILRLTTDDDQLAEGLTMVFIGLPGGIVIWAVASYLTNKWLRRSKQLE